MMATAIRPAAVAGTWYPANAGALTRDVDGYLDAVPRRPRRRDPRHHRAACRAHVLGPGRRVCLQGRRGAGPTTSPSSSDRRTSLASTAWRSIPMARSTRRSAWRSIDDAAAASLQPVADRSCPCPQRTRASTRSRCSCRFCGGCAGVRDRAAADGAPDARRPSSSSAIALANALRGRRALLVASTDLSHYFDAATAAVLDGRVVAPSIGSTRTACWTCSRSIPKQSAGDTLGAAAGRRSR